MHRKILFSLAAVLTVLVPLKGCKFFTDMQMPESVAVTSDATLTVPLGTAKYDISSVFGSSSLRETVQSALGTSAKLYDYVPADDSSTESVDVGSYLKNFDIESVFNSDSMGISFDQKITLPSISVNETKQITIPDVSGDILSTMKASMGNFDFPSVPEPGSKMDAAAYLNGHNSISITGKYAGEVTYDEGSAVNVVLTRTDTNE